MILGSEVGAPVHRRVVPHVRPEIISETTTIHTAMRDEVGKIVVMPENDHSLRDLVADSPLPKVVHTAYPTTDLLWSAG